MKNHADAIGHTAREALRRLEALPVEAGGSLAEPVTRASRAIAWNGLNHSLLAEQSLDPAKPDDGTIGAALAVQLGGGQGEGARSDAALALL
ncbi:MAG: hypothetical protein M3256_12650 [Actinomycetota bacterium]|nr:hypothetical protein [Actinomycetota bacterium]